ncbi:MAG: S41 family peptidase, partial [Pseudomonadota bacterium]|nr:S41 family peptidase [Pseudomonadota bacterium]
KLNIHFQIKNTFSILPFFLCILCFSLLAPSLAQSIKGEEKDLNTETNLLQEVLEHLRIEYIDDVEEKKFIQGAISGIISDLDSYSQFLDRNEYAELKISTSGEYAGVGLEIDLKDDIFKVVAVMQGAPAYKAGIRLGDIIISINSIEIITLDTSEVIKLLRGKSGTKILITIIRPGETEPINFNLIRRNVKIKTVQGALLVQDYAYIRISLFNESTLTSTRSTLEKLKIKNNGPLRGLLLDLRDNPGGLLQGAIDLSNIFLDSGLIVEVKGRSESANSIYNATSGDIIDGANILVLVNGGSASAAEIFAAAIQDNKRGLIVGTQTFGKGSAQTVIPLSDGSAIKITTSRYFTPLGQAIQDQGIIPDIFIFKNYQENLSHSIRQNEDDFGVEIMQSDSQLHEALNILRHKK